MSFDQDPNDQAKISGADLAMLYDELATLHSQVTDLQSERDLLMEELRGPVLDEPLRALGRKLADLLDSEQFNAVELLLKSCMGERAKVLKEAIGKLEYLKDKSEEYNCFRVPELRDDSVTGINECIHELSGMVAEGERGK